MLNLERSSVQADERGALRAAMLDIVGSKRAVVGIIGLGYVGLPLAVAFARAGFRTIGFDASPTKVTAVNDGRSYIDDVDASDLAHAVATERLEARLASDRLADCDCIIICVPTPLNSGHDPELSFIRDALTDVRHCLRRGQLIVLESTTYPGCTEELLLPALLSTGMRLDADFLLAFSPERIDPGNPSFTTRNTARVLGGCSAASADIAESLYSAIVNRVHRVTSPRVAETVKLVENTFRAVNIALVNELAGVCRSMDIDIWEVIEAAGTKPYGYMPFYPGPGIGGHCIPLDPAYLGWKARQAGMECHFIDLARRVNTAMPKRVVDLIAASLNHDGKALRQARVLVVGVAYKRNVNDCRESPALAIIHQLQASLAHVSYHDPHVDELHLGGGACAPLRSVDLSDDALRATDCAVLVTDHALVDYERIAANAPLVVDTRNAVPAHVRANARARIVRL